MVHCQLLGPKPFDFALVLLLPHPALLVVHLFETLVFSKLLHQFRSEDLLHALLFGSAFSFESNLEVLCLLKFLLNPFSLLHFSSLPLNRSFFSFLVVKLISEVFLKLLLCSPCNFLSLQLFENLVSRISRCIFRRLNLVRTLLLLLGVASDHLILVALHLLLPTLLGLLLLNTQYHVSLGLLHFELLNAGHLSIFFNHTLYNVVNLFLLLLVLLIRFLLYFLALSDLFLKHVLSLSLLLYLLGFSFTFDLLLNLFVA